METLSGLLNWWNLLFLLPIALSVLLLLASALGGLGEGGADGHADVDAHVDAHVEAHADLDVHAHLDGHLDATGVDTDHEHPLTNALKWAGVGAVPVSLLSQAFLLFFGIIGLAANRALETASRPDTLIWGSIGLAALGGLGGAGVFGALARRFLPTDAPAVGNKDLVGRMGRVVFQVTQTMGTAQVRDGSGTLHQIPARVAPAHEPLESGQEIIVTAYDAQTGTFLIDDSPFTVTQEELRRRA